MLDLLKPLIAWDHLPRQDVRAGEVIIAGGEPTSMLFLLEEGNATDLGGHHYHGGDVLALCEALALDSYTAHISASTPCRLVPISKAMLETALQRGGRLVLPLSRSIAADVTQRRMAG